MKIGLTVHESNTFACNCPQIVAEHLLGSGYPVRQDISLTKNVSFIGLEKAFNRMNEFYEIGDYNEDWIGLERSKAQCNPLHVPNSNSRNKKQILALGEIGSQNVQEMVVIESMVNIVMSNYS